MSSMNETRFIFLCIVFDVNFEHCLCANENWILGSLSFRLVTQRTVNKFFQPTDGIPGRLIVLKAATSQITGETGVIPIATQRRY